MSLQLSSSLLVICVLGIITSRSLPSRTTLTAAAAADLSTVEPELAQAFENTNPNVTVKWVTEASAALAQQIENGAPYDLFLSANASFVDRLASSGKLDRASIVTYTTGRLVLVWRDRKPHDFKELTANWVRFVGLPNPKLAPYGVAAREALQHERIWDVIEPKIVYGENVRQTLQLLETGNADAVLTSASLVEGQNADLVPDNWHNPITQKGGIVAGSRNREASRRFLEFLTSPAGQAIFAKHGFARSAAREQ